MALNVARKHRGNNKGTAHNKNQDIIYQVSAQVSLGHGD
jgi:hypothetical protein